MESSLIVIEERLRTGRLVALLLAVCVATVIVPRRRRWFPASRTKTAFSAVVVVAVVAVLASRIVARVVQTADGRRFEVVYGPGGMIRQSFDATDIEHAQATSLSLLRTGGWGYRGSLALLRRAAVVTRSGDALRLDLSQGRRFAITVDDPTSFAEALNS